MAPSELFNITHSKEGKGVLLVGVVGLVGASVELEHKQVILKCNSQTGKDRQEVVREI